MEFRPPNISLRNGFSQARKEASFYAEESFRAAARHRHGQPATGTPRGDVCSVACRNPSRPSTHATLLRFSTRVHGFLRPATWAIQRTTRIDMLVLHLISLTRMWSTIAFPAIRFLCIPVPFLIFLPSAQRGNIPRFAAERLYPMPPRA
ncbi:hypothetical protein ACLOJK_030098 [Asimina triloba]